MHLVTWHQLGHIVWTAVGPFVYFGAMFVVAVFAFVAGKFWGSY